MLPSLVREPGVVWNLDGVVLDDKRQDRDALNFGEPGGTSGIHHGKDKLGTHCILNTSEPIEHDGAIPSGNIIDTRIEQGRRNSHGN